MDENKICKKCQGSIPKKAVVCMHCGAKQGHITFFKVFVWSFVILFIYAFISISNEEPVKQPESANTNSPAQQASKPSEQQQKDSKLSAEKYAASTLCMDAVRKAARFPSSVDFSAWDSIGTTPMSGGGWKSQWAFEAKNGLGTLIPQKVYCEIKNGKLQQFIVRNR